MRYIAMCSCGKDSLAMVLKLIETNTPLTEVLFYDTGMEFDAIYKNWNKLVNICKDRQIKTTVLKPPIPFEEKAFDILVKARDGTIHKGYSWCGGRCRWGTTDKIRTIDKYCESEPTVCYIGIAVDEINRIYKPRKAYKSLPLLDWNMSERDCLEYCYENGWSWKEDGIELYDILDRVSCWCCRNKNKKELRNMFNYLPRYWGKLRDFQSKTKLPMKKYRKNKTECGSVFELEIEFRKEVENESN